MIDPPHRPLVRRTRNLGFRRAFTLVELLVVIGIIALLIGILLPALTAARKQAMSVACEAGLRDILQAMQMYVSENKGYIPGSPVTSGAFLFKPDLSPNPRYSNSNCPDISQDFDWQAPLAHYMNLHFETGGTTPQRQARFEFLRMHKAFQCPANTTIAGPYAGSPINCQVNLDVAYATATQFLLLPADTAGGVVGVHKGSASLSSPSGYVPKITKVGDASQKIYIADGARYSNNGTPPDIDLNYDGSGGGAFGDVGAFTAKTNCWNRLGAPQNQGGGTDARIYAFRHGKDVPKGAADTYRFNVGFFDGHVESLGDLQGSNPAYWMPKGSHYDPNGSFYMCKDAQQLYGNSGPMNIP